MLEYDLLRALPGLVSQKAGETELVLIDFIDERFSLAIEEGVPATFSVSFQECAADRSLFLIRSGTDDHFRIWERGFDRFMAQARHFGLPVWVHAVSWGGRTREVDVYDADKIARANVYLEKLYAVAWRNGCTLIRPNPPPLLDPDHRWGMAAFHYERIYYETLISALNAAE